MMSTMERAPVTDRHLVSRRLAESIDSYDKSPAHFAARYDAADTSTLRHGFESLLPDLDLPVLDAGCGTGRDLQGFAESGIAAFGVDLSPSLLAEARRSGIPVPLIEADLRALPVVAAAARGVWAMASLVHLDDNEVVDVLREFGRVTSPRGPIFVSVMEGDRSSWHTDPAGRRWFNRHNLPSIRGMAECAGLSLESTTVSTGSIGGQWLNLFFKSHR